MASKGPLLLILLLSAASLMALPALARPCHSIFFPDPFTTTTLIHRDGGPGVLSITSGKIFGSDGRLFAWIDFRIPSDISQVRMINLHRKHLENPSLIHGNLEIMVGEGRSSPREEVFMPLMPVRNPHSFPWVNEVSRHEGVVRRNRDFGSFSENSNKYAASWINSLNDLCRILYAPLLGVLCGVATAAVLSMVWSLCSRVCGNSCDEEEDIGLVYGYQQLPASEKQDFEKGMTKETTPKSEDI